MRAITVRQPWAAAIVWWGKSPENRTRNIAGSYRGPVAIHAGLREDEQAYDDDAIRAALRSSARPGSLLEEQVAQTGAFIGVADLVDVHAARPVTVGFDGARDGEPLTFPACCESPWAQFPWYGAKPIHHLVLANARPIDTPIPCRGRLGLWTPEHDVLAQLEETR